MTILWSCTLMTVEEAEPLNLLLKVCHFFNVVQNSDGFTEHVLCGFCSGAVKSNCCQHLSWDILSLQWESEVGRSAVDLRGIMHISMLSPTNPLPGMGGGGGARWGYVHPKIYFPTHRASCWIKSPPLCGEDLGVGIWHICHFVQWTCGIWVVHV